jgi:Flp pilus assembly protein TadG
MKFHHTARRKGNAVVEMALVLPILLYLAFGTVEFGHFFYVRHNVQAAAREGARAAVPSGATNTDVTNAINAAMAAAGLQSSGYTVTLSPTNVASASTGSNVSVTLECNWGTVGLRPMALISSSKSVQGNVVMRKE